MVEIAKKLIGEQSYTQAEFWQLLLANDEYYQQCKHFIDFALKFLNRTFNETIVESEVSSLEDIETKKRNLNGLQLNVSTQAYR